MTKNGQMVFSVLLWGTLMGHTTADRLVLALAEAATFGDWTISLETRLLCYINCTCSGKKDSQYASMQSVKKTERQQNLSGETSILFAVKWLDD